MTETPDPRLAAHAALAAEIKASGPLPEAHAAISAIISEQVHVASDGTVSIMESDGKTLMLDPCNGWANASVGTLMGRLRQDRPELFGITPKAAQSTGGQISITEEMRRAKADPAALSALLAKFSR